jgi:hypothetical protein
MSSRDAIIARLTAESEKLSAAEQAEADFATKRLYHTLATQYGLLAEGLTHAQTADELAELTLTIDRQASVYQSQASIPNRFKGFNTTAATFVKSVALEVLGLTEQAFGKAA